MGYGRWEMGYGIWVMGDGRWEMGYGLWVMGDGRWVMGYGLCLNPTFARASVGETKKAPEGLLIQYTSDSKTSF